MNGGDSVERDNQRSARKRPDPDAPGAFVDDEDAPDVPEPNEPA